MMSKKEYEIYSRINETAKRLEKVYFEQKEMLTKLFDYIELRKSQLQYAESREEMEFIQEYINNIRRNG